MTQKCIYSVVLVFHFMVCLPIAFISVPHDNINASTFCTKPPSEVPERLG